MEIVILPTFTRGEVYLNPEDSLAMITEVVNLEGVQKVSYITDNGDEGFFYSNDHEIIDNISKLGPNWHEQSHKNHLEFLERGKKKGRFQSNTEITNFLALAIAGEAGELGNLHKKHWRGDDIDVVEYGRKAQAEAADIYIYLRHYAHHMGFDLDEAAAEKVDVVTKRLA